MKKVTSKDTIAFHRSISRKYRFKIIRKQDSHLMHIVANALEVMKVVDADEWMKRFAITIVEPLTDKKWVYVPWEPGNHGTKSLISQNCILAHESEHSIQGENVRFGPRYLTDEAYRSRMEFYAMRPQMELYRFFTRGKTLDTRKLANILRYYDVRKSDIRVTKKKLDIVNVAVKRGIVSSTVGKYSVRWWQRRLK
jgi:hypothetical protein